MSSHWFRNGDVYTVDAANPWARSVVVLDERIAYVGDDEGAREHLRPDTVEVDLDGRFLMPGFVDGHDHLIGGGIGKLGVSLDGLVGKDAVIEQIRRYALDNPDLPVIRGHSWTPFQFGNGQRPHRTWLDPVTDVRPALMNSYDFHDGWANTAAFIAAGIDASTPDPNPPASFWPRDPDGFPSGCCCDGEAWMPIAAALGMFSLEAVKEAMQMTLFPAPSWGITTYFDASTVVRGALNDRVFQHLVDLDSAGELPVRIVASHALRDPEIPVEQSIERLRQLNNDFRSPNVSITTLKLFADGVGPQHTAAMLEPYADEPDNFGPFVFDTDAMSRHVLAANAAGFDVHIHACGDAGVRGGLDANEAAQRTLGRTGARNTICHLEFCNPADIPRFAELGVTANGTPIWGSDYRGEFLDAYPTLVGTERLERDFLPYGSVLRSGATLTFGGDCPGTEIHEIAPLKQIESAVTRQRPGRPDDRIASPHERMSLADAIRCYTVNGAYALRLEDEVGSITVGKQADLQVLAISPFRVASHEIHTIAVDATMLGGRFTHQR